MEAKLDFYERYGVEEYYFIDPYEEQYEAFVRRGNRLRSVLRRKLNGFISPRLGVRFQTDGGLKLFAPEGREFRTREEREQEILEELRKTALAFEDERSRAVEESRRADAEHRAKELLAAKLRELGVDPDSVLKSAG